ncbi:hypothetical protein DAPK24_036280 [Pichia kluyveri]|uniref:Karyogamy protein 5 n=1 Tax=Pichia kluyveri TaxID=36015 RepID=A0AAV5R8C7_PICKL|nr:hypothetical protein DAPK24_036280 [Pichia kluyveri]
MQGVEIMDTLMNKFGTNLTPYFLSIGASMVGVFIGSIYSDNESLLEFQRHLDQESYFREMVEHFVGKEMFFSVLQLSIGIMVFVFFMFALFLRMYVSKLINSNNNELIEGMMERLQKMEDVIELVLKDNNALDLKQVKLFNQEIEEQKKSFNDLITNKSLELETKLSDVKNTCVKVKNLVHVDYKKIMEISSKFTNIDESVQDMSSKVEKIFEKLDDLQKKVDQTFNEVEGEMNKELKKINDLSKSLHEQNDVNELNILKCNAMLTNSRILLDASIAKFENLEKSANEPISEDSGKLICCLKEAVQLTEFLENPTSTNDNFSKELPFHNNSFTNSINSLVFELMKKLTTMEEKMTNQLSMINKNTSKIKKLDVQTTEKLTDLKFYSDEWITAWVSVIYSLFNSSFLHLETQLFGIDSMEYPNIFDFKDAELKKHSKIFYQIMDQCKETCLKIVKEVNLLIFEYYLVQTTYTNSNTSLLSICYKKIDDELFNLFEDFEFIVKKSEIPLKKQTEIINTLCRLKCDLSSDLKSDTDRFNGLVKQNLDDFYLIHDTMKSLFKDTGSLQISDKSVSLNYDSVIELSDHSNSIISVSHEDSSFSENDSSLDDSALRPFKLNSAKRRSRDLDFVEL